MSQEIGKPQISEMTNARIQIAWHHSLRLLAVTTGFAENPFKIMHHCRRIGKREYRKHRRGLRPKLLEMIASEVLWQIRMVLTIASA